MAITEQPKDFSDLFTMLQNAVRMQTGVTASENQAKRAINVALNDMHVGFAEKYPWAERSAILVTQPEYITGTVTISQGSTSLTGASTAWNTANAFSANNARVGGKVVIDGGAEVYEVSAVGGDTAITLTSAFVKADVSGGSYVYFEDEYALHDDFARPVALDNFDTADEIELIGGKQFRLRYPRNRTTGKPRVATLIDKNFAGNTTPVRRVVFWQPPKDAGSISYSFITNKLAVKADGTAQANLSADTDEPIVPLIGRYAIVLHALAAFYRDKRDDTRSQEVKAEYTDLMLRIAGDQEIGRARPQFQPRSGLYLGPAQRPWRGGRGRGRYTTGNSFDQLRS